MTNVLQSAVGLHAFNAVDNIVCVTVHSCIDVTTVFAIMVHAKINAIHVMMEAALMDGKRVFQMMISIIRISAFRQQLLYLQHECVQSLWWKM